MPTNVIASTPTQDLNRGNILIVDDHQDIIDMIEAALEGQPANLYAANNGQAALRELSERPFDVLLLDAKMPGLSGFDICRMVKSNPDWQHIKVMIVSANANFEDKVRAYEIGADDYIIKPFKTKEFLARIRVMLNLRLAERKLTQRNEQLLELLRVFQLINMRTELKPMADEIARAACNLTKSDRGYLMLWDEKRRVHRAVGWYNPALPMTENTVYAEGVGLCWLVRQQDQPVVLDDYDVFAGRVPETPLGSIRAAVAVPLKIGHRPIGVLMVLMASPEKQFAPSDLDLLTLLAERTAISIENTRLYNDLRRSEETYRLITEKASDLIISLDREGYLTYVNERARTLLNYEPLDMIGRKFADFLTDEGRIAFEKLYHAYFNAVEATNGTFTVSDLPAELRATREIPALTHDAAPLNIEFSFGLVFQEGEVVGLQAIGRDVTARKQYEETERMRLLGQMASGVAHDFNNVLANVLGHAQLLAQETEDAQTRQILQIIAQSARDGADTVRRIQEFTNQRTQRDLEIIDVNEVVESSLELSRPRWRDAAQSKGLHIEIERQLDKSIPKVLAKAASLREALINLINNAVDAMNEKGDKLGFRSYVQNDMVCLDVYDNGPGIPPEVRRHIFEPYFTTKGVSGTGLGLSITFGILARFGGQISCESSPDVGTTFTIRLPIAPTQFQRLPEKAKTPLQIKKPTQNYTGRILAIDDEVNIRNILKRALSLNGFEVDIAGSGGEALEMLEKAADKNPEWPYQVIFSDLGMPGIGGWEVANIVRQKWPNLPVVLVTGWGEQLDPARLEQSGVRATIAKPFNINDLVTMAVRLIPQDKP